MIIDSYRSFYNADGAWWLLGIDKLFFTMINWMADFTLVIDRLLYQMFDWMISLISNPSFFNDLTDQMLGVTVSVFNNLRSNLLSYVFVFVLFGMVVAFTKKQIHTIFKIILEFIIVLFLALFFVHNTTPVVKGSFSVMDDVAVKIISGVSFQNDTAKMDEAVSSDQLLERYRAGLLREMVEDPWAIMNFGRTYSDEYRIKDENGNEHSMKDFLVAEDADPRQRDKEISELVDKTVDGWFASHLADKLIIGICSIWNAAIVGLFVTFSILFVTFLKIGILVMYVLLPVIFFMEMIPFFRGLLPRFFGMLVNFFMQGLVLQLMIFIFLFFFSVLDGLVDGFIPYLAILIVKILLVTIGRKQLPKLLMMGGMKTGLLQRAVDRTPRSVAGGVAKTATVAAGVGLLGVGAGLRAKDVWTFKQAQKQKVLANGAASSRSLIKQSVGLRLPKYDFQDKNQMDSSLIDEQRIYKQVEPETAPVANTKRLRIVRPGQQGSQVVEKQNQSQEQKTAISPQSSVTMVPASMHGREPDVNPVMIDHADMNASNINKAEQSEKEAIDVIKMQRPEKEAVKAVEQTGQRPPKIKASTIHYVLPKAVERKRSKLSKKIAKKEEKLEKREQKKEAYTASRRVLSKSVDMMLGSRKSTKVKHGVKTVSAYRAAGREKKREKMIKRYKDYTRDGLSMYWYAGRGAGRSYGTKEAKKA